ncbi:MAG: hypothetical protein M0Z94_00160 [Dehalococcoidales bacterium]|nr:hypothetical protein [Dehalococcoidales bacterium]
MATLYETILNWREAYNTLNQKDPATQAAQQVIVERMVDRLRRHRCLADLAAGYYRDGEWWKPVVHEFSAEPEQFDGELIHKAAYFQRLLQIRQPGGK